MSGKLEQLFFRAIDLVNQDLPPEIRVAQSRETVIAGSARELDSLGIVVLLRAVEDGVQAEYGFSLDIGESCFDDPVFSMAGTVGALIDCVAAKLDAEAAS